MTTNTVSRSQSKAANFVPLLVDVAVPIGSYYLLKDAFGVSTLMALGLSSVAPAVRTVWGVVRERRLNAFAALILCVNVMTLVLSFVAGDPRLMLAKDSGVSSVIGVGILVSVALGRPMMTEGMKPWLVKGDAGREAAWARLQAGSPAFRRAERVFSLVWGVVLLAECAVRVVGAYTLPVDTMVWLGTVILIVSMVLGFLLSGALAAGRMAHMVIVEARSDGAVATVPAPVATSAARPTAVPVVAAAR